MKQIVQMFQKMKQNTNKKWSKCTKDASVVCAKW